MATEKSLTTGYESRCEAAGVAPHRAFLEAISQEASSFAISWGKDFQGDEDDAGRREQQKLNEKEFAAIVETLGSTAVEASSLTSIDVSWAGLSTAAAGMLAAALRTNRNIRKVFCCGNPIGADGAHALAEAVGSEASGVTVLRLSALQIMSEEPWLPALMAPLSPCARLAELDLGSNNLGPADAASIAQVLPGMASLQTLQLRLNSIGDDGFAHILSALSARGATSPCIETLDVSGNGLTNRSAEEILRVGERMKQTLGLRRLALRSNMISDQGAELLAQAIVSPGPLSSVEALLLGSNPDMTARTAELFLQVILAAPKLRQLDLQGVALNRAGAESLAKCLRALPALEQLVIDGPIEADAIAVITDISSAMASNTRITELEIGSSFVSQNGGSPSSPGQLEAARSAVQRIQNAVALNKRSSKPQSLVEPSIRLEQRSTPRPHKAPAAASPSPSLDRIRSSTSLKDLQEQLDLLKGEFQTLMNDPKPVVENVKTVTSTGASVVNPPAALMNHLPTAVDSAPPSPVDPSTSMSQNSTIRSPSSRRIGSRASSPTGSPSASFDLKLDAAVEQLSESFSLQLESTTDELRYQKEEETRRREEMQDRLDARMLGMAERLEACENRIAAFEAAELKHGGALTAVSPGSGSSEISESKLYARMQMLEEGMRKAEQERWKQAEVVQELASRVNQAVELLQRAVSTENVRTDDIVPRTAPTSPENRALRAKVQRIEKRMAILEKTVVSEQESSLRALQAILEASQSGQVPSR